MKQLSLTECKLKRMKKTILYLFILTVITACQVVKMPKKPLIAEQVALAYFLDSLVPNDPHLKGRAFDFDFVVRQGIGAIIRTLDPQAGNMLLLTKQKILPLNI